MIAGTVEHGRRLGLRVEPLRDVGGHGHVNAAIFVADDQYTDSVAFRRHSGRHFEGVGSRRKRPVSGGKRERNNGGERKRSNAALALDGICCSRWSANCSRDCRSRCPAPGTTRPGSTRKEVGIVIRSESLGTDPIQKNAFSSPAFLLM